MMVQEFTCYDPTPILPELPAIPFPTGVVTLEICGKPRSALVIYSDGSYKFLDVIEDSEFLLLVPQLRSARFSSWHFSHDRLCGLVPL